ncbi:MAG: BLUF domain-containing protein [Gammaproteobacteria bacterium]|nr:BLUF domain-containing protein [Gammaproteobacteria bacterium]
MALMTLAYVSEARPGLSLKDLKQILRRARENNFRRHVSGFLVFDGVSFAQILEAEAEVLGALMAAIEIDDRHHGLRLLLHESVAERHFPQTCMGCANLAAPVHLDTSELRGLIRDVTGSRQLGLREALEFFDLFSHFRTPEQAALLTL